MSPFGFTPLDPAAFKGIFVPAPQMVLISPHVTLAKGVTLWPGTVLLADADGPLHVGEDAEIGFEGGFTIDARGTSGLVVGAAARLLGGGSLAGPNDIGAGAQILGPIRCQRCELGAGGNHREPDPDRRGAVLKGCGVARDIVLAQGEVIQAFGLFAEAPVRRQVEFHPPPSK